MSCKFQLRDDILPLYKADRNSVFFLPIFHEYFFKLSFINKMNNISFLNNEIELDSAEVIEFEELYTELNEALVFVNSDHTFSPGKILYSGNFITLELTLTSLIDVSAQVGTEQGTCSDAEIGTSVCYEGNIWTCFGPSPGDWGGGNGACS